MEKASVMYLQLMILKFQYLKNVDKFFFEIVLPTATLVLKFDGYSSTLENSVSGNNFTNN